LLPLLAGALFLWSVLVVTLLPDSAATAGGVLLVAEGVATTACVIALVATAARAPRLGPRSNRQRATTLAFVYARLPSRRTLLVVGTYAVLFFLLSLLFTTRQAYERDTETLAQR